MVSSKDCQEKSSNTKAMPSFAEAILPPSQGFTTPGALDFSPASPDIRRKS
jgi:hypothetical protein